MGHCRTTNISLTRAAHADLEAGAISSAVEHSLHMGGVAGSIFASLDRAHFPDSVISADFAQRYRRRAWCFALNAGKFRRQTPDSGHRRWENDGVTQSLSEITGAPSIAAGATAGVPRRGGSCAPATKRAS
jgi:hypothetical protein